jgi:hypothetical protein
MSQTPWDPFSFPSSCVCVCVCVRWGEIQRRSTRLDFDFDFDFSGEIWPWGDSKRAFDWLKITTTLISRLGLASGRRGANF